MLKHCLDFLDGKEAVMWLTEKIHVEPKCYISFAQACVIVLLTMSSTLMNKQSIFNKVSLHRSTHKTSLCIDHPMKV